MTPSIDVLQAFGVSGKPERLIGGEGNSYLVNNVVFKPVSSEDETIWRDELFSNIIQQGFTLAKQVKTTDGRWTYGGWEASLFVEGRAIKGRWSEKIAVSRIFHNSLKDVPKPPFLGKASHPWAVADRMVWGEQKLEFGERLRDVMEPLIQMAKPGNFSSQLIHGDMTGNILFSEQHEPVIIDFSPYWRPAEFATAIIVVDSIVWEGAPDSLLTEFDNRPDMNQLLVKATMWRIKTTEEYIRQFGKGSITDVDAYQHCIELLKQTVVKL